MSDTIAKEVQEVLTTPTEEINFEELQSENSSPLNQPVIEKDIGGEKPSEPTKSWNVWKPEDAIEKQNEDSTSATSTDFRREVEASVAEERENETLDAPEQDISNDGNDSEEPLSDEDFELPLSQANQAADALLGMTNNMMEVGGGYFVKIQKHEEFFEFDEIIQIINDQNDRNIQRVKLDKEDQALLRPLLAQVLRKKAKKLSPEQQLMGAILSILVKKAQIVMEVRAENNVLEERILNIIREEKGYEQDNTDEDTVFSDSEAENSIKTDIEQPIEKNKEVNEEVSAATVLEVVPEIEKE